MKLKFINLLLASVLLVGSAQVFTSCKDNEADLYVNLKEDTITLKQRLDQDEAQLKDLEAKLNKEIADRISDVKNLTDELKKTNDALDAVKKDLKDNYATKAELEAVKKDLEAKIKDLNTKIEQNISDILTLKGDIVRIDGAILAINGRLDGIDLTLDQLRKDIDANHQSIIEINTALGDIKLDITKIKDDVVEIYKQLDALNVKYNDLEGRLTIVEGTLKDVQSDIKTLNTQVGELNTQVGTLNAFMNEWSPVLPEIQKNASDALALAKKNANDIAALQALVELLQGQIELGNAQSQAALDDVQAQIDSLVAQVENCATLEELAYVTAKLQQQALDYYNASVGYTIYMCAGLHAYIDECMQQVNNNITDLDNKIDTSVATLEGKLAEIEKAIKDGDKAVLDELNAKIDALNDKVDNLEATLSQKIAEVIATYIPQIMDELDNINNALTEGLNKVNDELAGVKEELDGIKTQIKNVTKRVDEVATRINGILIQQTNNNVFGTLNLPFGINSNMLIAYAGQCIDRGAMFPAVEYDNNSYNKSPEGLGGLTAAELAALGVDQQPVGMGILMNTDEEGNGVLGTVYMTINPANIDLDGKTFAIVNSQNKALPVNFQPTPSNEVLDFGYTRATTSANGFFEADATISLANDGADLNAVRFTLNPELKSTVKEVLNAPKASAKAPFNTIAKLANAVYDQVNGMLPAYGISASWTESDGKALQVTSQYGLAVATVNPLALSALESLTGELPTLKNLPDLNFISEKFDAYMDHLRNVIVVKLYDPNDPFEVTYENKTFIVAPSLVFDVNQSINVKKTIPVEIDIYDADDPTKLIGHGSTDVDVDIDVDLKDFITNLNAEIQKALGKEWADSTNAQINAQIEAICNDISKQVNDLLASMQDKVDQTIETVLNDIQQNIGSKIDKVTKRISGYYNRVQSLIDRLNKVLDNPSYYVQPVLFYKNGNEVKFMSTSKAYPTQLVAKVSNPAIELVPTTYTLETAVPLFKKYVAVTHAWNADGTENVDARDAANNTKGSYMNQVVPAQRHTMALKLTKGCTYEIIYQGLDYSGLVSGRKYYVTVK